MNTEQFLRFNRHLPANQPRLIRGPSGIGKSAVVATFAATTNRTLIKLDLSLKDPPDIEGLPFIEQGQTRYARPYWWPTKPNSVLLLDEIDRCSEALQPVAMGLVLDRAAGQHVLPKDTLIFATANGERFLTNHLDQALLRRFVVVDFKPTVDEWLKWAAEQKLCEEVRQYVAENRGELDTPMELIGKAGVSIPCRSTWTGLGEWLDAVPKEERAEFLNEMRLYGTPFVGMVAAARFGEWLKVGSIGLKAEAVYSGTAKVGSFSVVEIAHVASEVAGGILKRNPKEQANAVEFFAKAGKEQMAAFMARLPQEANELIQRSKFAMGVADAVVGSIV